MGARARDLEGDNPPIHGIVGGVDGLPKTAVGPVTAAVIQVVGGRHREGCLGKQAEGEAQEDGDERDGARSDERVKPWEKPHDLTSGIERSATVPRFEEPVVRVLLSFSLLKQYFAGNGPAREENH